MAATNRPEAIDPALLRPGRFDVKLSVSKPDADGRLAILQVYCRQYKVAADIDLKVNPGARSYCLDFKNIL